MKSYVFYLSILAASVAGCEKKSEIKVYRVSKAPLEDSVTSQDDTMPTNAGSPAAPSGVAPVASTGVTVPAHWEPQPLSQMRQASFLVKGDHGAVADISLVSLGASADNVLENVNRWLSQLGQPPVAEKKLDQMEQRLMTSAGEVTIVDLAGLPKDADPAKDGRILGAMATTGNATLFFKIRGNSELTEAQKADFIKWVAAVCNSQTENKPAQMTAPAAQESRSAQIKWKTPGGWTEVPASSMRYASFNASGTGGAKIDVSVVTFPGDGGSDGDNVNRWRQQLGLPPADESAITSSISPLKSGDTTFSTIDIPGSNARTIAAWARRDGRVWFFKATGPGAAVEKEKTKFIQFVQSVQF